MKVWRIVLAVVGIGVGMYGISQLLTQIPRQTLVLLALWLIAVRPEANANDGKDDPPDLHESTSMVASHLVLNTPARFGAISRNG